MLLYSKWSGVGAGWGWRSGRSRRVLLRCIKAGKEAVQLLCQRCTQYSCCHITASEVCDVLYALPHLPCFWTSQGRTKTRQWSVCHKGLCASTSSLYIVLQ
ncbi:hypothetical protein MHYP_G00053560 [Metynnis hypsauchen]